MSVKELYMLCGNWLSNTTVSVYSKSTSTITQFTYYKDVIASHGDKLVNDFCYFPADELFVINVR